MAKTTNTTSVGSAGGIDVNQSIYTGPQSFNLDDYVGYTFRGKVIAPLTGSFSVTSHINSGLSIQPDANGVVTFGFFTGNHAVGLNNNPHYGEGKGYTPFSEAQKAAAISAIGLWDDLVPLTFQNVGDVSTSEWAKNQATILLQNTSTGPAQAWAYYPGYGHQYSRISSDVWTADPNVNNTNKWFDFGGYGNTTLIHELGHTLGLSHPGAYNFGPGFTVNYTNGAEYAQDSLQYSIMSYWSGGETGQITRDWLSQQANYPQTPLLHDIFVIQEKYGADLTTRVGDTTYGFHSNAGKDVYDFTKNPYPNISIYDAGGNDTLDLSGSNAGNFINLHPGSYSSVGQAVPTLAEVNAARAALSAEIGQALTPYTQATLDARKATYLPVIENNIFFDTGVHGVNATQYDNLSIAYNTIIENAVGGSQRDVLWGNDVANHLSGMGGDDVLQGFGGNDTLTGGDGNDTFVFGSSDIVGTDTITDFQTGADKIDLHALDVTASNVAYNGTTHQVEIDLNHDGVADMFINSVNSVGSGDFLFHA